MTKIAHFIDAHKLNFLAITTQLDTPLNFNLICKIVDRLHLRENRQYKLAGDVIYHPSRSNYNTAKHAHRTRVVEHAQTAATTIHELINPWVKLRYSLISAFIIIE